MPRKDAYHEAVVNALKADRWTITYDLYPLKSGGNHFRRRTRHYLLFYTGWDGKRRVHGNAIHVTLRGDKIWVQHDGTRDGIVDDLLAAGIPPEKIVLGFHHPNERKYTEFVLA